MEHCAVRGQSRRKQHLEERCAFWDEVMNSLDFLEGHGNWGGTKQWHRDQQWLQWHDVRQAWGNAHEPLSLTARDVRASAVKDRQPCGLSCDERDIIMAKATHGFDRLCPVLWRCDRTLGWDTKRHPAQCIKGQEAQCTQQAHTSTQGLHQKVGHEAEILPYYETSLPHIRSHASICAVRDEWSMENRCHRQPLNASASGASRTVPKLLGESPQWSNVKRVIFASGVFVDWSIHLIWSARRRRDGDWRGRTFCCEHVAMKEALPNATVLSVWLALERVQPSRTDHDDSFAHSCSMVARLLTCQGKARFIETSHHGCEHVAQWMCEVIINFVLWML